MIAGRLQRNWIMVGALLPALLAGQAQAYVLGPTAPGNWGGPGASVSYSFMATGVNYDEGGGPGTYTALSAFMPGGWQAEIERALQAWSDIAGISFTEVADVGEDFDAAQTSGDIRFGGQAIDGGFGVLAHGYYPPVNGVSAAGDVHFDTGDTWVIGFPGPGFDIFQVAAHEIGHAIGLAHTLVPSSLMNASYTEAFSGPQADDIAGAQFLFGAASGGSAAPEPLTSTMALISIGALSMILRARRPA